MNLNTSDWKEFQLGDIFEIKKGKRLTSDEQVEGTTPYVGAIDSNNGIANYIGQSPIHAGNTISLSYNGSVGEAFYQPRPFWATDDVNVLYFRAENGVPFNKYIAMFFCTILKKEKYRYSYGRKWVLESMRSAIIKLPHKHEKPDFQFMEDYIKSLKYKPITTKNWGGQKSLSLGTNNWKEFLIGDIFEIYNGKYITQEEIEENAGDFIAVQSGEENNGVLGKIDKQYCIDNNYTYTFEKCLTVARSGSAGFVSYQNFGCVVGDSAKILLLKDKNHRNPFVYLFLRSLLMKNKYKYTYGRKVTTDKYLEETIKLPVVNDEPNWDIIEAYMKELPYGDRICV